MRPYEILEHTGDVKIMVFGKTKQELFLNAMRGMMRLLQPQITKHKLQITKRRVNVSSQDLNALLVDFLSEVNYLVQTNKEIYNDAKFIKFSDTELEAELTGSKIGKFGEEIKAVTYHGLEVKQNQERFWEVTIIFDI